MKVATKTDTRTPIRDGRYYCCKACGGKCTYADYRRALKLSEETAKVLGLGWVAAPFENLGWYANVRLSDDVYVHVNRYADKSVNYTLYAHGEPGQVIMSGSSPHGLIDATVRAMYKMKAQLDVRIADLLLSRVVEPKGADE